MSTFFIRKHFVYRSSIWRGSKLMWSTPGILIIFLNLFKQIMWKSSVCLPRMEIKLILTTKSSSRCKNNPYFDFKRRLYVSMQHTINTRIKTNPPPTPMNKSSKFLDFISFRSETNEERSFYCISRHKIYFKSEIRIKLEKLNNNIWVISNYYQ